MKVCLRFGDTLVLLLLSEEMTAAKATTCVRALIFLFNLIATNCGLCAKMQLPFHRCAILFGAGETSIRRWLVASRQPVDESRDLTTCYSTRKRLNVQTKRKCLTPPFYDGFFLHEDYFSLKA
jgi:hypothetical protein